MNVVQRLRELADNIEQSEKMPTFAPDELGIYGAMNALKKHAPNYDLDFGIRVRDGKETEFGAALHLLTNDRYASLEKCFISSELSNAVNLAIAHRRSEATTAPDRNAVHELTRVLAPMIDQPF